MKKIRHSVFETNSSSTHGISILSELEKCVVYDTIKPTYDNKIILTGKDFGWEVEKYNDPLTKANYFAIDNQNDDDRLQLLKDAISSHTGCEVVLNIGDHWIDHQSIGTTDVIKTKEELKEFIFNSNCFLYTGNDNDDLVWDIKTGKRMSYGEIKEEEHGRYV